MTNKRHKNSGGQALVMVTLALMAMAGLMGLAVDLGWSYFVQKEAQAAADGAALAAVQEAVINIRAKGIAPSAFACGDVASILCQATPTSCKGGTVTGTNLQNGCLYAKANGFDYNSSRQNVTVQSNDHSTLPPTAPGVNNITYWVTVRTVQTIPQLFSAVLGNTLGTVSAIGTAGVVGEVSPGSFYGMNRQGDCLYDTKSHAQIDCGMDIDGSKGAAGPILKCGNLTADVCAPKGIILASACNASGNGCSNNYGADGGNAGAWGSSLTMMQGGTVKSGTFTPSTPTSAPDGPIFQDQYAGISQPPVQVPSSPIGSCGYPNGSITGNVTLGPYQYYSYTTDKLGNKIPNGNPITTTGNVTFSTVNSGACPGGGFFTGGAASGTGTDQKPAFPAYIFWGGLDASANKSSLTFGPGQYVMAGTSTQGGVLFNASSASGDTTTGTMFVFTDGNYPGLSTQTGTIPNFANNMPVLYQGVLGGTDPSSAFKNATIDLTGVVGSSNATSALPAALDAYSGIVWWQDRRNSTVGYNQAAGSPGCPACTGDDGSVIYCAMGCPNTVPKSLIDQTNPASSANHVTYTSPQIGLAPGGGRVGLNGVIYQPRGAWLYVNAGNSSFACTVGGKIQQCPLEVVTGALVLDTGVTGLLLAGPTNPIIKYKAALIQ